MKTAEMVYKITLKKDYGLTDRLIKKLGKPNKFVKNPHYKSGPEAGLYSIKRVENFLKKHKIEIDLAKAARPRRIESACKAVETKTQILIDYAKTVQLIIKPLPKTLEELQRIASRHASDRYGIDAREPGMSGIASTIRHEYTNYDEILRYFKGKVGGGKVQGGSHAYNTLRERLDADIDRLIFQKYTVGDGVDAALREIAMKVYDSFDSEDRSSVKFINNRIIVAAMWEDAAESICTNLNTLGLQSYPLDEDGYWYVCVDKSAEGRQNL